MTTFTLGTYFNEALVEIKQPTEEEYKVLYCLFATQEGEEVSSPVVGLDFEADGSVTVGYWPDGEEWVVLKRLTPTRGIEPCEGNEVWR